MMDITFKILLVKKSQLRHTTQVCMIDDAHCGCASGEKCCPHNITDKFEFYIEDLEVIIDKTLRKFSRAELQDYLDDVSSDKNLFKSQLHGDPYLAPLFERTANRKKTSKGHESLMSQDDFNVLPQVLLKHSGQGGGYPEGLVRPRTTDSREPRSRQIINEKREKTGTVKHNIQAVVRAYSPIQKHFTIDPHKAHAYMERKDHDEEIRNTLKDIHGRPKSATVMMIASPPVSRKQQFHDKPSVESFMSPLISKKLPRGRSSADERRQFVAEAGGADDGQQQGNAVVEKGALMQQQQQQRDVYGNQGFDDALPGMPGLWRTHGGHNLLDDLPNSNAIPVCLRHIVELFVRRTLPWQGFLCRSAIESVRTLRTKKVESIYGEYMSGMCEKLRAKVTKFLDKKLEECTTWANHEREIWEQAKRDVRDELSKFINQEISRQRRRDIFQKTLQKDRDMKLAVDIESTEKRKIKEQLSEVIGLCNGASEKMDSRALHVTIGAATVRATVQATVIKRGILKKEEAAYEWLRCVADNAITADVVESGVKKFLAHFRREKKLAQKRLVHTRQQLEEQYASMLKIIDNFCKQIVKQTKDHTTRERLVSRGFATYVLEVNAGRLNKSTGLLNNNVSPLERDQELEHTIKRAERNCKHIIQNRAQSLRMLDKVKNELAQKVTSSYNTLTNDIMSDVFSHRDADVQQYLTDINKVLKKVVQIACNTRRKTLSENNTRRATFFRFEDECLVEIGSLMANLRFEMDEAWRTEHMLGVKINHAAQSRLDDVIASNEEEMKFAFKELSCFLEGERSNVHWVDVAAETLDEKQINMLERMHNLRTATHFKWIMTIRKAMPQVFQLFDRATKQMSGGEDEYGVPFPLVDCNSFEFQEMFKSLGNSLDDINSSMTTEHSLKDAQESITLTDVFEDMRTFIDSAWKENILIMNEVLATEVQAFLKRNGEFKEYLSDYNMMNEIEMYVFEQASSNRLDKFWTETHGKNRAFSSELQQTLNRIIQSVEKEHALKKGKHVTSRIGNEELTEEKDLSISNRMKIELGASEMTAKLNSSHRHNFSAEISATPQTFNVARNLSRMSLITALHNNQIDLSRQTFLFAAGHKNTTKLVIDGHDEGNSKDKGGGLTAAHRLTVNDFNTVNQGLKHFIANIPVSRIRSLVKHVKNEFQVLSISLSKQQVVSSNSERLFTSIDDIDPIFNFLTMESDVKTSTEFKYSTKSFVIPVGKAFKIIQDAIALFVHNSKLITDFVYYFQVKRRVHGGGDDKNVKKSNLKQKEFVATLEPVLDDKDEDEDQDDASDDDATSTSEHSDSADDDNHQVEIVCGGDDGDGDGAEDVHAEGVADIFGTTTVLDKETDHAKAMSGGKVSVAIEALFPPDSEEYKHLVDIFSLSAATLVMSQVAQYHQKIDINAITVYLSKNLRNVCLTSSYSLILAISTMKTRVPLPIPESSQQTTPQPSVSLPRASMPKMTLNPVSVKECSESSMKYYSYHLKHHLPTNCAGLQEMLQAEVEWMLAALEVDSNDITMTTNTKDPHKSSSSSSSSRHGKNNAANMPAGSDKNISIQREIPQPLPPPISKKGIHCSEDLSDIFKSYGTWMTEKQAIMAGSGDAGNIQLGAMKGVNATCKRLQGIGVPDMDICMLVTLLGEDTVPASELFGGKSAMLHVCPEKVTTAVKMWRLVAFCKMLAMVYCSQDKMVVADISKAELSQNSLNVFEFDGIESVLARQDTKCTEWKCDLDSAETIKVQQMSPFDGVGKFLRRFTCIAEVPFSYLQGMAFLATNGGFMCDPWVLEPTLSTDSASFYSAVSLQVTDYVKLFMLQGYMRRAQSDDLRQNVVPSHALLPSYVPGTLGRIQTLCKGNNLSHILVPIEILRDYCDRSVVIKELKHKRSTAATGKVNGDGGVSNGNSTNRPSRQKRAVTMTTTDVIFTKEEIESSVDFTHAQITLRFWTGYRQEGVAPSSYQEHVVEKRWQHIQAERMKQSNRNLKFKAAGGAFVSGASTGDMGSGDDVVTTATATAGNTMRRRQAGVAQSGPSTDNNSQVTSQDLLLARLAAVNDTAEANAKNSEEDAVLQRKQKILENSVLDLLDLEKSVAGFTGMIDTAVADQQDIQDVPSAFTDTIGVMMTPMSDLEARNTVNAALQYEPTLHHPLQKSICVWAFSHHRPYNIDEVTKLIAREGGVLHEVRLSKKNNEESATAPQRDLSKYYPSYHELRRRMELSLLLQFSSDIIHVDKSSDEMEILDNNYDKVNMVSSAMVYYWKYLSSNRVKRIENFASILRTVMFNHWSDILIQHRSKRHVARSDAQQSLFSLFKTFMSSYKVETLHQRDVLRKLYKQVVDRIDTAEDEQKDISSSYLSIFKRITDMYTTFLKSSLVHYKNSKISYMTMNKAIFQKRQSQIEFIHEKCRVMLREASTDLLGSFIEDCVKPQLLKVSESVELGEQKYQKVLMKVEAVERVFLSATSDSFINVAREVKKSINEFEYVVKDLIYEWSCVEDKIKRFVRKDQVSVLSDMKSYFHDLEIQHNQGMVPFFERYREIESIVVSYMMERYYSYLKVVNNEEDSVISSKAPESVRSMLSANESLDTFSKRKQTIEKKEKKTMKKKKKKKKNKKDKEKITQNETTRSHFSGDALTADSESESVSVSFNEGRGYLSDGGGSVHGDVVEQNGVDEEKGEGESVYEQSERKEKGGVVIGSDDDGEDDEDDDEEEDDSDVEENSKDEEEVDEDAEEDDDANDIRDEDGLLVLLPNQCGLDYLLRLHKKIETFTEQAKANLMGPVRDLFMADIIAKEEVRRSQVFKIAHDLVDLVSNQWTELHRDLQLLVSSNIVTARDMRSEMSLSLWTLCDDFRKWELNRLALLNEASVWKFKSLRRPGISRSDAKDLKVFERFARECHNVIISAEVDLAPGHADVMPAEMATLLTQINNNPTRIRTEFSDLITDFYKKSHSDEMHYSFLTTLEYLSNSLHDVRLQLKSVVDEYEQDKRDTISLLKYNSNVKRHINPDIQVAGVLDTMVETVVARSAISKNLLSQVHVTDRRSKIIEKRVHEFLQTNSLSDHFLENGTMDPKFVEDTAFGTNSVEDCKLKSVSASQHGICLKCTADLFYTVRRNDVIYSSKISAVSDKLKGLVIQEQINARTIRKQLHTQLKRACLEVDKVEFGIRNEIIGCLEVAFKGRVLAGDTNSRVNEPADSISGRAAGPFVRDTNEILHELVAAVKKPPRSEGNVIDYPEFSDFSDDEDTEDEDGGANKDNADGDKDGDGDVYGPLVTRGELGEMQEESNALVVSSEDIDEVSPLVDLAGFSVENVYFNGIFQRTNDKRDGNPVLHGDKTTSLPKNPMEFPGIETLKEEEEAIEEFLRRHEEFALQEKEMEQMAIDVENDAIVEAQLVASYDESQEALEAARRVEEEILRVEEEKKAAEREAIRLEAYEQAELEFFQKYPDKDPNIYSYSNKFDETSLSYKSTRTMVNPKSYVPASDEYKDQALEKLLSIGANPEPKRSEYDLYIPPPDVPSLPLATILARYQDMRVRLPYGWEEKGTNEEGEAVYYNKFTKETSVGLHPSEFLGFQWRLCYTDEGHEYYYNDESGESTWRRPRITLHKKSPRDGETSYNSTQWTSPFKPTHPANVDADTVDQFIGDVDESYYDESYWNQSTYGGGDGGVVAETEHNMEYEMDSVGGLSAQTDDSRNMCCHIGQDNADVDIYKFNLSPRGQMPHYPDYREATKPELPVLPITYPDFRDNFKLTKNTKSFRIEGNLTSFGSKTVKSIEETQDSKENEVEDSGQTLLETSKESPLNNDSVDLDSNHSRDEENADNGDGDGDDDGDGGDEDVVEYDDRYHGEVFGEESIKTYTEEDEEKDSDVIDDVVEDNDELHYDDNDNNSYYDGNDIEDAHGDDIGHSDSNSGGSVQMLQQGGEFDVSPMIPNLEDFKGGFNFSQRFMDHVMLDSGRLRSGDSSLRLEDNELVVPVTENNSRTTLSTGSARDVDSLMFSTEEANGMMGMTTENTRPLQLSQVPAFNDMDTERSNSVIHPNRKSDSSTATRMDSSSEEEQKTSHLFQLSQEANTLYSDVDTDRSKQSTPKFSSRSQIDTNNSVDDETFEPFRNVPQAQSPTSPRNEIQSENYDEHHTTVDSNGVEWTEHYTEEGDKYFANTATGETFWHIDQEGYYFDHDYSTDYMYQEEGLVSDVPDESGLDRDGDGDGNDDGYGDGDGGGGDYTSDHTWHESYTDEGHKYYYNSTTGESRWAHVDEFVGEDAVQLEHEQFGDVLSHPYQDGELTREKDDAPGQLLSSVSETQDIQNESTSNPPLLRSHSSRQDILNANRNSDKQLEVKVTFAEIKAQHDEALNRSRERKRPEKSLLSNFPLFASSVDSLPDGNSVHSTTSTASPDKNGSSSALGAYGAIVLPNFTGSPLKKSSSPLKKSKSFKKEKKANVVRKL